MTVLERDWLVPSAIMTALLGLTALLLMPVAGYHEFPPYFSHFINWMDYAVFGAGIILAVYVVKLQRTGVERPIAHLKAQFLATRGVMLSAFAGMMLAGIDNSLLPAAWLTLTTFTAGSA